MDNFSIVPIGAVAEYDGSTASDTVWYDKSGNDLDGTVTSATLENKLDTIQTSGITFPATQHASSNANTLDDYEEGTFTVALTSVGGTIGLDAAVNELAYTKIGRVVHVNGLLLNGTFTSTPSGAMTLTGLPFAGGDYQDYSERSAIQLYFRGTGATDLIASGQMASGETQLSIELIHADAIDASTDIYVSGHYITAT
jgi:hypothetical protein